MANMLIRNIFNISLKIYLSIVLKSIKRALPLGDREMGWKFDYRNEGFLLFNLIIILYPEL